MGRIGEFPELLNDAFMPDPEHAQISVCDSPDIGLKFWPICLPFCGTPTIAAFIARCTLPPRVRY
jgi:hypothetical protein